MNAPLSADIFKAYDIRGIVDHTLTEDTATLIGQAIGSQAAEHKVCTLCVGRDGRLSSERLAKALIAGLRQSGRNVINVGQVTTPMLYFAGHQLGTYSGVMVTGSHNPPQYNGFKIMLAGHTLAGDDIQALKQRITQQQFTHGNGALLHADIADTYFERITSDIRLARPLKIAIDCGNGVAGAFAGTLFRRLGCEVRELFCEVNGQFPNHHPDPSRPENLADLQKILAQTDAEIGLAFDGDGDRLGVVTKRGDIIFPDRQLMLFAQDVLSRQPNATIIYDVKSTGLLENWITQHGGQALIARTGHSYIKAAMKTHHAALAGEMSGHIFFKERWFGFDDGLYAGARLLEILSRSTDPSAQLHALPHAVSTPEINISMPERSPHDLIAQLQHTARFPEAKHVITIDGLRVEYADGFGLIRASNTTPVLVLRFEAENHTALERIQTTFRDLLRAHISDAIPF